LTIAIIAAEDFELNGLRSRVHSIAREEGLPIRSAYRAEWRGHRLLMCANGPGFALAAVAARAAISAVSPDRIWSVGLCGGLDSRFAAGDVVTGEGVVDSATGERFDAMPFEGIAGVTVVSQDRVAADPLEKARLALLGGVVDMESAAVAREALAWAIPFQCIKVVSDIAREGFAINLNRARDAEGRFATTLVLAEALRRPVRGIPELASLYRRSRAGAERLGDWIGNCRI
jgi:nucleoside phosphorylase